MKVVRINDNPHLMNDTFCPTTSVPLKSSLYGWLQISTTRYTDTKDSGRPYNYLIIVFQYKQNKYTKSLANSY